MKRDEIDLHHGAVGQVLDLLQAGNTRDGCAAAHIDKDAFSRQCFTVHIHFVRRLKSSMPLIDGAILHRFEILLHPRSGLTGDLIFPRLNLFHIYDYLTRDLDSEICGAMSHMGSIGAGHHRLGGDAPGIDARSTEFSPLDNRNFLSRGRQAARKGWRGLPGSDDDGVIGGAHVFQASHGAREQARRRSGGRDI